MKTNVSEYDFRRAFEQCRPDNFSYDGLTALYDYLIALEEDCGEEMELDVIAICCDFSEYDNFYQAREQHDLEDWEALEDHTTVIWIGEYGDEGGVILQNF